ncbi:hypothetical protein DASC09_063400 [Saccharomycopsis crataegensis]|uniref:Uncharacterized protein n=1 Tax=Saccharomycopsis crataegensis TaxID=43959 RepID=A0AAV5QWW2_9ASCO|nr:hypothetical protein DASC09_063400 [Saccharomycopsis crataegensis]
MVILLFLVCYIWCVTAVEENLELLHSKIKVHYNQVITNDIEASFTNERKSMSSTRSIILSENYLSDPDQLITLGLSGLIKSSYSISVLMPPNSTQTTSYLVPSGSQLLMVFYIDNGFVTEIDDTEPFTPLCIAKYSWLQEVFAVIPYDYIETNFDVDAAEIISQLDSSAPESLHANMNLDSMPYFVMAFKTEAPSPIFNHTQMERNNSYMFKEYNDSRTYLDMIASQWTDRFGIDSFARTNYCIINETQGNCLNIDEIDGTINVSPFEIENTRKKRTVKDEKFDLQKMNIEIQKLKDIDINQMVDGDEKIMNIVEPGLENNQFAKRSRVKKALKPESQDLKELRESLLYSKETIASIFNSLKKMTTENLSESTRQNLTNFGKKVGDLLATGEFKLSIQVNNDSKGMESKTYSHELNI